MNNGDFSQWLQAMRSPASTASSWADTDSDSDSDCESASHFGTCLTATTTSKCVAASKMLPTFERTAPMLIPQKSRRRRAYFVNEFAQDDEDSLATRASHLQRSTTSSCSSSSLFGDDDDEEADEDEDDPTLYQNLAYFRLPNTRKTSSHRSSGSARSRSLSPSPSSPATSDEDIFDMEL